MAHCRTGRRTHHATRWDPFDNARHRFGVASESQTGCPSPADEKEKGKEERAPCHSQCIPRRGACGKAGVVPHNPPSEGRTLRMGVAK
jgi:hypothetical protein